MPAHAPALALGLALPGAACGGNDGPEDAAAAGVTALDPAEDPAPGECAVAVDFAALPEDGRSSASGGLPGVIAVEPDGTAEPAVEGIPDLDGLSQIALDGDGRLWITAGDRVLLARPR